MLTFLLKPRSPRKTRLQVETLDDRFMPSTIHPIVHHVNHRAAHVAPHHQAAKHLTAAQPTATVFAFPLPTASNDPSAPILYGPTSNATGGPAAQNGQRGALAYPLPIASNDPSAPILYGPTSNATGGPAAQNGQRGALAYPLPIASNDPSAPILYSMRPNR